MCVWITFAYGGVLDPLNMYRDKDCEENFAEYIEAIWWEV